MNRGTTLIELLTALSIVAITSGVVVWPIIRLDDRFRVEAEAGKVLVAYRRAQSEARALNREVSLEVSADSIVIRLIRISSPITLWQTAGPRSVGVELAPGRHQASFAPNGLGVGVGNVTHVLTRGSARRQVVVSRLGRVKVVP